MSRIEVRNLDAWVLRFLRSKRYEQSIVYGRQDEAAACWHLALAVKDAALGFDDEFYAAEPSSRSCWRKASQRSMPTARHGEWGAAWC